MARNSLWFNLATSAVLAIVSSFALATDAYAKRLYVSPSGDGSSGQSWKTAWHAPNEIDWDKVEAGDRIILDGGTEGITYIGSFTIPKGNIVIRQSRQAKRRGQVTLAGPPLNAAPVVSDGITIAADNVHIIGNKRSGINVRGFGARLLILRANNCTLKNIEIGGVTGFPPYGYGRITCLDYSGYNNRIRNCDFRDVTTNARETVVPGKNNLTVFRNCTFGVDRYGYWGEFSRGIVGADDSNSNNSTYAIKCVFGPYCSTGVDINDGNLVLSKCLFLGAHLVNLKWSPTRGSSSQALVSKCTFFTENLTGSSHYPYRLQQIATSAHANMTVRNSIIYGGVIAIPAGKSVNGGGNFQYRVSGNTLAVANQIVDPMFKEDAIMSKEVTPSTIRPKEWTTTSYELQAGSPATGKGSPIVNVTDIVPAYGPDRGFPPLGGP